MGCNEFSCGTGSGVITFPSDPSNNSVLSAVGVFGGIEVSWTYPSTNPNAVAYVVLYRGITNVFSSAIELTKVAGTYYFDRIDEESLIRTYYYWIQLVSVNGTEMEVIGPASATPRLSIEKTIEDLTGKIDAGVLANALRTEIGKIGSLQTTMSQEVIDRLQAEGILGDALAQVQTDVGEVTTLLQHEVIERKDAHGAIVAQVDVLAAGADANAAAITELSAVIVDSTSALASKITTMETKSATDLGAAIQNEQLARTAADNSLAAQINTVQSTAANNLASVQTTMQTNINTLNGKVTSIGALYTAKVGVNGLIGGFGIYNDGATVEAGFDVDHFWIGRGTSKAKPFEVIGGITYIANAAIKEAAIDTLKIAGNAVTMPLYAESSTTTGATTASADFSAGSVILILKVKTLNYSGPVYVKCNGVTIATIPENKSQEAEGQTISWVDETITFKHTPGGSAYYSLHTHNANRFQFSQITALGCKR